MSGPADALAEALTKVAADRTGPTLIRPRTSYRHLSAAILAALPGWTLVPKADAPDVTALREASTQLVRDWDKLPCPTCGGTGVAWDWPAATDLRAALMPLSRGVITIEVLP